MKWSALCAVTAVALFSGCGGSASTTHVDGTFHHAPLDVRDAAFVTYGTRRADGEAVSQLFLQIGDKGCGVQAPGGRLVQLGMFGPQRFGAGSYAVTRDHRDGPMAQLWGTVGELDSACALDADQVVGGTLTLHDFDFDGDALLHGAFDVTLFDGEHLSGAFDAMRCEALLQPLACK